MRRAHRPWLGVDEECESPPDGVEEPPEIESRLSSESRFEFPTLHVIWEHYPRIMLYRERMGPELTRWRELDEGRQMIVDPRLL